jgi:hypothetical protein
MARARSCRSPGHAHASASTTTGRWGTRHHTAIEQAIGAPAGVDDWEQQPADMLGAFRALCWPRTYLRLTPPETGKPAL